MFQPIKKKDKLNYFILTQYAIVKDQKKSPRDYNVYDDNPYIIVKADKQNHGYNKYIGNLQELLNELVEEAESFLNRNAKYFDFKEENSELWKK